MTEPKEGKQAKKKKASKSEDFKADFWQGHKDLNSPRW
jgi:hypothetical protein